MANNCFFDMKIAGEKSNVEEFIQMLKWQGPFENCGLGRVYYFEESEFEPEISDKNNLIAVKGSGDCAWSVLTAMRAEYRGDYPSLESETKRLNLAVEIYSSEPGVGFQEHLLINQGEVIIDDCVDYYETWTEEMTEEDIKEFCESHEISREQFDRSINDNGDYIEGGFGESFCDFNDLFTYFEKEQDKTYSFTDDFGDTFEVKPYLDLYVNNNNLYMGLLYRDPELNNWQPYSDITVNIIRVPYLYNTVDITINKEGTLKFLQDNGFGQDTGKVLNSGFNQYPVFRFNEDKLKEIDPKIFEEYAKARGHILQFKGSLNNMIEKAANTSSHQEPPAQTKDNVELDK